MLMGCSLAVSADGVDEDARQGVRRHAQNGCVDVDGEFVSAGKGLRKIDIGAGSASGKYVGCDARDAKEEAAGALRHAAYAEPSIRFEQRNQSFLAGELGDDRDAAVVREITKLYEECVIGTLAKLVDRYAGAQPKGEIVIVVGPPAEAPEADDDELDAALDEALKKLSPSRAAAEVAARLKVPRKRAYARALELTK
jgi:hypothetical protein